MPKALVPVAGRPMIEFALLLLRHYGVRDIVVNLHHFGAQIEDHLGDGQRFDVKISYSHEAELLETGGGLLKAKPFLQHDTFIVINTDALIDVDLAAVLNDHRQNHAAATLVLRRRQPNAVMGPAQFTAPLGPLVPILASVVSLSILAGASTQQLLMGTYALIGGGILFAIAIYRR